MISLVHQNLFTKDTRTYHDAVVRLEEIGFVCKDNEGRPVVIDNSNRNHEWPENDLHSSVTELNIKWWTCIY